MTRPSRRIRKRSATASASRMFCSTIIMVTPCCLSAAMIVAISSTKLGRQPAGGLVEQQHARLAHQRAADRHHLLLAARHQAHALLPPLRQAREGGIDAVEQRGRPGRRAPRRRGADFPRPTCPGTGRAACDTCTMPWRNIWCGSRPASSCPSSRMEPDAGPDEAADRVQAGRFAAAVGAQQRDDLAAVERRNRRRTASACSHSRPATPLTVSSGVRHGRDRPPARCGRRAPRAGVPSATLRP